MVQFKPFCKILAIQVEIYLEELVHYLFNYKEHYPSSRFFSDGTFHTEYKKIEDTTLVLFTFSFYSGITFF